MFFSPKPNRWYYSLSSSRVPTRETPLKTIPVSIRAHFYRRLAFTFPGICASHCVLLHPRLQPPLGQLLAAVYIYAVHWNFFATEILCKFSLEKLPGNFANIFSNFYQPEQLISEWPLTWNHEAVRLIRNHSCYAKTSFLWLQEIFPLQLMRLKCTTMCWICQLCKLRVGIVQVISLPCCRDLANQFNKAYDVQLFPQCQWLLSDVPRIKNLRNPELKMSKSDFSEKSRINLDDDEDTMRDRIRKAVTDHTGKVREQAQQTAGAADAADAMLLRGSELVATLSLVE